MAESDSAGSDAGGSETARPSKRPKREGAVRSRVAGTDASKDARGVSAGTGSVCKLFVKKAPSNFSDPWRKHSQQSSTGTGFLVGGRWIVTNAHVVHRAVSVLVRATTGPPIKYNAKVVAVGLPCDLAVLALDADFWNGKESLELSTSIPRLDDNVTCIGFPVGGENISVTRGVVSRIDVNMDGVLRVQIDAAINPGNSGGPVLGANGLVVGVASSHLKNASNIGYIIPTSVVHQFLSCLDLPGAYLGVSSLGIGRVQTLESPALRTLLALPDGFTGGVRVPKVWPLGSSAGLLQEDDVILEIDGVEISQDATVPLRENERINFLHLVTKHLAGRSTVHVKVWRHGAYHEVDIAVQPDRWLVPRQDGYDAAPEFTIVGGLVFVPLSHPWAELKSNDKHGWSAARSLIHSHWGEALPEEGRQIVILSKVLAHPCNVGYHSLNNVVLESFGGAPVRNVAELARAVAACKDSHLVFQFKRPAGDGKELVVLSREECSKAQKEVLDQHLIAAPCMVRIDGNGEPRPLPEEETLPEEACRAPAE
ncbi:unnamed protein product [Polarella glacialis]|nr:unnamed protein product [Polarella glacialis]